MSDNIPCRNPKLCNVKSHLPGTVAKCHSVKVTAGGISASTRLAVTPLTAMASHVRPTSHAVDSPQGRENQARLTERVYKLAMDEDLMNLCESLNINSPRDTDPELIEDYLAEDESNKVILREHGYVGTLKLIETAFAAHQKHYNKRNSNIMAEWRETGILADDEVKRLADVKDFEFAPMRGRLLELGVQERGIVSLSWRLHRRATRPQRDAQRRNAKS